MARVVVAERHSGIRSGLREILAEHAGITLVDEMTYAGELLARCQGAAWDVALVDVSAREGSGQQSLRAVRRQCPALRLLALTFALDYHFVQDCLGAGADGVLAAEDIADELVPAIRAVLAGEVYLSRAVQSVLAAGPPG